MILLSKILTVAGTVGLVARTFGGTLITNNLPADTAIVNISAAQDGAAAFNGDQSLWYRPFNTTGTLLKYSVQPGIPSASISGH